MTAKPHSTLQRTLPDGRTWDSVLRWFTKGYSITAGNLLVGPGVATKLIPEAGTQPAIRPWSAILHTNAGYNSTSSLWAYVTQSTVTGEPHLQVAMNGGVEQYMPFTVRADCNYSANRWAAGGEYRGAISFETQDRGSASLNKTPWTPEQLTAMVGTLTALCVCYGIACTQPAAWDRSGIGHHSLFPFQGVGSKAWTNVRGKTCPGSARIAQMDYVRQQVATQLAQFGQVTGWQCRGLS